MRLGLSRRKKDVQGQNARSSGMKMTIIENAWPGWTEEDSRKKDLGFVS